jgi:hypothetical protein
MDYFTIIFGNLIFIGQHGQVALISEKLCHPHPNPPHSRGRELTACIYVVIPGRNNSRGGCSTFSLAALPWNSELETKN